MNYKTKYEKLQERFQELLSKVGIVADACGNNHNYWAGEQLEQIYERFEDNGKADD